MVKDGGTRKNGGSAQFMCSSSTLWATSRHFDCRLVRYMIYLVSWAKSRRLVLNEVKPRFTAKCILILACQSLTFTFILFWLARKACQKALRGSLGMMSWLWSWHQHHYMAGALPALVIAMDVTRRVLVVLTAHKGAREESVHPSCSFSLGSQSSRCKEVIRLIFLSWGSGVEVHCAFTGTEGQNLW